MSAQAAAIAMRDWALATRGTTRPPVTPTVTRQDFDVALRAAVKGADLKKIGQLVTAERVDFSPLAGPVPTGVFKPGKAERGPVDVADVVGKYQRNSYLKRL